MSDAEAPVVEIRDLRVQFTGERNVYAINGVDLSLKQGEFSPEPPDAVASPSGPAGRTPRQRRKHVAPRPPRNGTSCIRRRRPGWS